MLVVFPYLGSENIGITYLSAMLKSRGFETKLAFEPAFFDDKKFLHIPIIPRLFRYNERFSDHIVRLHPKVLAFSVFTANYLWALDIAKRVKEKIDVVTVFGGVHVQALPAQVLLNPQVDYIILGEGEYALAELAESINNGAVDFSIKNLGYKRGSGIVINEIRPLIEDLDTLPFPDRHMFAKFEDYKESILYLCGRGCPFVCTFCANSLKRKQYPNAHKYVRLQSVDRCLEELRVLADTYATKNFQIQDDVFTLNIKWLQEFCQRYPREVGVPFQVAVHPAAINENKIKMLKEAGCIFIQVGIQSFNQKNRRDILHRYEREEDVIRCIGLAKKYSMGVSVDYIFFPWECNEYDQLKAALFFYEHQPTRIANFYLSYLPGTDIIDYAKRNNYLNEGDIEGINIGKNAYYHTGGEFRLKKKELWLFNNFYNFFLLLLIFPKRFGKILFKIRLYRYARFIPRILLLIIKELFLPLFSKRQRFSSGFIKYVRYYQKNAGAFLMGRYG